VEVKRADLDLGGGFDGRVGEVPKLPDVLTIGEVARRSGVPHTALRFYEERGLIHAERTAGNQRKYARAVLRRLAFIRTAQRVGLSNAWRGELDARIDAMQRLRDRLTACIGCGCLSLKSCHLMNHNDVLAEVGPGAPRLKAASEGGIN
jgi:MerR family redox-sensitive transcriptional activator SoxR